MGFPNALLPAPDFSKLAKSAAKGSLPGADIFAGPASGTDVSPKSTDASSSGPNYGVGQTNYAPALQLSGAYTPDYNALINNEPSLLAFRGNEQEGIGQADAARQAAIRALAVRYGGLPKGVSDVYGDIDQGTLDEAGRNQFSDIANLGRNYDQTITGIKRALAARGMLRSGELGYGLDQAALGRAQQEYTLGNNFGNAAQLALNNYATTVQNLKQQEAQAISDAAKNVYSNPANRPADAVMAKYDADASTKYGQPVYGLDGKFYNPDGSPYTPPAPSTSTDTGGTGTGGGGSTAPASGGASIPNTLQTVSNYVGPFIGPSSAGLAAAARGSLAAENDPALMSSALSAIGGSTPYGNAFQRRRQLG